MKSARIYDFTLTAGGSFQLPVEGDYVRIMTSTGPIELVTESYRIGPVNAGQGQANTPFKRLTITDKSGAGNVGTILIASADFVDQRISGEVSVIDGGKSRTISNSAYLAVASVGAVDAMFAVGQLANPAGSTKNVIVESVEFSSTIAVFVGIAWGVTQMATLVGSAVSKKTGGTVSGAKIYKDNIGAPTSTNQLQSYQIPASIAQIRKFSEPIVVTPGYFLNIYAGTVNVDLNAAFEFYEEAV